MKTTIAIAFVIGVIVLGVFVMNNSPASESTSDQLPNVVLQEADGSDITLSSFIGKPLVVNSWAVWCPFCRQELPDFAALQKEFGDAVVVIAVDRGEPREKAKGYTDELGITNDMIFLLDPSDAFYKAIGGFSMPETIFVTATGDIALHKRGPMTLEEMREAVNQYLR